MANPQIKFAWELPEEVKIQVKSWVSEAIRTEILNIIPEKPRPKTILTRQETAKLLDISLPTLNEYTKSGVITACRLGYKVRYKLEDVERALVQIKTK